MKKFLLTIGFLFALAIGAQAQTGCVELREIDGAPDVKCVKIIRVTNGTLSCTGTTCTITISGGGGGSPGGSDTQLQYNNSGSFGGITGATTNGTVVTLTNALATTAFSPSSNDGAALGSGTASFSDLFLASGALINFANGNAVITHSSGIITVSTGDLRVTTAGTNTASAVTVGGTQTLTNKTLASPSVTGNISAATTSLLLFGSNYYRYIDGTGPAMYDTTTDKILIFNVQSLTDNRTVTWPDTALTVAGINVANSWSAGVKQTFAPNGTTAGINVGSVAGDPSAPANGDLWYDSTANELTARINGANVALGSGGGGGITVGTTTVTSGTATRLFYETAGNVVGQVSGVTSDGTNVTAGSGNLRATSPRITTNILDANGQAILAFSPAASAINNFTISSTASTAADLTLSATGTDSNIGISILAKGTANPSKFRAGTTDWYHQVDNSTGFQTGNATNSFLVVSGSSIKTANNITVGWTSSASGTGTLDLILRRNAAAHMTFGAADAASPVAQTLSVQNVVGGTSNTAGANWTLSGSRGTGTGAGGSIIFQTAPAGGSGTSQNALVTALTIPSAGGMVVPELGSAPGTPSANNVHIYALDSGGASTLYYKKDDGTQIEIGSGGGGSPPFADNTALVMNNADNTKRIQFSAASISASTTRVITAPDTNGTLVYEANTATLTNKTLSNVVLAGDTTVSGDAFFGPGTRIGTEVSSTDTLLMSAYDVDGGVYVDFLRFTANNTPTLEVLQSLSWADGVRQTFNPNGTNAGLNVGSQAGAPTSLSNGDIWYDSTANKFKCRENGSTVDCIGSGGGGGLGDPGANGIVVRTALNTTTARTLTAGSSAGLTVTNGDGVSGNPTVDFATVNTSGLGFNLPGQGGTVFTYDSSSALVGSANEVRVVLFYAPMRITVDRVALNGATDSASNNAGVGIYSADGNTKICDSGAISTTSWSGAANYALSSSCTFGPGFYYYAWTANSTTPTVRSAGSIANYYNPLNNGSGTVLGTAANASSGGVLPSTLGALTDSGGLAVPIVRFYKN